MTNSTVIALRVDPVAKDLGEFTVRRALPDKRRQRVGPFIFFDHMGPAEFAPGNGVNVRSHPHIGLATITYLFEGEILHRDSLGCVQPIRPGEVNWMTAGSGIVHSEKVTDAILASGQKLHGIQTWVALPREYEETDARFEHYTAADIPKVSADGVSISVIIGNAYDVTSPVQTASETLYVELKLEAGSTLAVPEVEELGVYVIAGEVAVDGQSIAPCELAILEDNSVASITATANAHVILFGGAKLEGERIVWWNFVSSSRERLEQAKRDWSEGRFGEVPGESDFIPLPKN
jgi:redox-sensitive bicupin YhaK (pirin superfamily)